MWGRPGAIRASTRRARRRVRPAAAPRALCVPLAWDMPAGRPGKRLAPEGPSEPSREPSRTRPARPCGGGAWTNPTCRYRDARRRRRRCRAETHARRVTPAPTRRRRTAPTGSWHDTALLPAVHCRAAQSTEAGFPSRIGARAVTGCADLCSFADIAPVRRRRGFVSARNRFAAGRGKAWWGRAGVS